MSWFTKKIPAAPAVKEKSYDELYKEECIKFPLEDHSGPITTKEEPSDDIG